MTLCLFLLFDFLFFSGEWATTTARAKPRENSFAKKTQKDTKGEGGEEEEENE